MDTKRQVALQNEISKKERAHLEKPVARDGFLKFADYNSKLEMMDTALFLFGMKLHRQIGSVEFYDADFCNTLTITSPYFVDKTLADC